MYAALLSETRETDKAEEVLKKLQWLEPDDPEVAFRRAMNFLEARRLAEAERVLEDLKKTLAARKADASEARPDRRPARLHRLPEEGLRAVRRPS